jgi:aspartyl-tRNA(Asn)/glutamyl-tRNA(Gln) amidotransferase subunit A
MYIGARERQGVDRSRFLVFLRDFTALLMPTTAVPALPLEQVDETAPTMSRLTRPVNYLGLSALAVPCGFDDAGCPLSFQIIGRPYEEEVLLRIGYAYEQAAPQQRRPEIVEFDRTNRD